MAKQNFNDFYGEESNEMTTTTATSETTKERVSVEENARLNATKFNEIKLSAKDRANRFLNQKRIEDVSDHGFDVSYHRKVAKNGDIYLNVYVADKQNPSFSKDFWKQNNHFVTLGKIVEGKYTTMFYNQANNQANGQANSQETKSKKWGDNYEGFVGAICNEVKTLLFLREFPVINKEIVTDDGTDEVEEQMSALKAAA